MPLLDAAINVIASSHTLQDGRHDTPEGYRLVRETAMLELIEAVSETQENDKRIPERPLLHHE
jgi:hypothetical protein